MAQNTEIAWATHTANLWWGCTKVHAGCDNCYAEYQSDVLKRGLKGKGKLWGNDSPRREIISVWSDLAKFQRLAKAANEIHTVFVGSMMDIFEKPMRLVDIDGNEKQGSDTGYLREMLFQHISNNIYPNLMFLLLTKRPSNISKYIPEHWKETPPNNVMFGTSPVNQETFDTLVPQLLQVNGKRFLSIEPMLGVIGFKTKEIARPWPVPFFFKQIDKVREKTEGIPVDLQVQQVPPFAVMLKNNVIVRQPFKLINQNLF